MRTNDYIKNTRKGLLTCPPDIKMDTEGQERVTVLSSPTCLIHFKEGPLICFTETSLRKSLTNDIAKCIRNLNQPLQGIQTLYYHRECYSKFTNVTFIKHAQSRFPRNQYQ